MEAEPRPPAPRRPNALLEWAGVALLFVALTLVYTDPLWRRPGATLADRGDALHNAAVTWWLSDRLRSGSLAGLWNLPPTFHPERQTLALCDPQFGGTLLGFPLFAATGNALLAYNFVVLLAFPLGALGAYALARRLTGSRGAALAAGVAWGFGVWHDGHAAHQQILSLWPLPFLLLALHNYGETRRGRWLAVVFLLWTLQAFLSAYWGAFLVLLVAPFALLLLRGAYRLSWPDVGRAMVVIALAAGLWIAAQYPLLLLNARGYRHPLPVIIQYSADLSDYLPRPGTLLWGGWGWPGAHGFESGEFWLSPGLFALALAVAGARRLFRSGLQEGPSEVAPKPRLERVGLALCGLAGLLWLAMTGLGVPDLTVFGVPRLLVNESAPMRLLILGLLCVWNGPARRLWGRRPRLRVEAAPLAPYLALALLALVWSCGYTVAFRGYPLFGGLHGWLTLLPGARGFRVLARMGILADLALAVLMAFALTALLRRLPRPGRVAVVAALCALIWAENVPRGGTGFIRSGPHAPSPRLVDRWLARQPPGAAVELPLTAHGLLEPRRMWSQTFHHKPLMNGMGTYLRRGYLEDLHALADPASPAAVARLRAVSARYVLLDTGNAWAGEKTVYGLVPRMPPSLPAPYVLRFTDGPVKAYELPRQK